MNAEPFRIRIVNVRPKHGWRIMSFFGGRWHEWAILNQPDQVDWWFAPRPDFLTKRFLETV